MKRLLPEETKLLTALQIGLLVLVLLLTSCTDRSKADDDGKLRVVTTTGMINDAVLNIGKEKVSTIALMGPGVDPHLYKATQGDLQKLTDADLILYNGLHLEGKMGEVFEKLARLKPVVAVTSQIPPSKLRKIEGFEDAYDPHIWFDVALWREAVKTITTKLQQLDTVNAQFYEANAKQYLQTLDSLDQSVHRKIHEIPEAQRVLITAHDAFGYFGDAYNIHVRGLQGISTVSEFGLRDVTELVNFIIERKIKAIFVESSVSGKSIEAVIEGCREKNWNVQIGGTLYSDAMGQQGTSEGTYVGMVNANVQKIAEALK